VKHQSESKGVWTLSAGELLGLYASGDLSPVEVVAEQLERIERLNPQLNAYLAVDARGALEAARTAERLWRDDGRSEDRPALCGVPVSVKDTVEIAGMPTTYGSLAFKDHRAGDSEIGQRLRRAGAVILGKTNTPEFALSTFTMNRLGPPAVNPWDVQRSAGGSSGGAGAAVAAGLGPIAIGTDSAGSIRLPAAYSGVLGLKPTFGAVPVVQGWRASPSRSHSGVLTRSTSDARLAMEVLTGGFHGTGAPSRRLRADDATPGGNPPPSIGLSGVRIAILPQDPDHGRVLENASAILKSAGANIVMAPALPRNAAPTELEDGVWAFAGEHYAAAEALCPDFWTKHAQDLTEYAYPLYEAGLRAKAWQYRRVLDLNEEFKRHVQNWFEPFDFVLTSVSPSAPEQPASIALGGLGPRFELLSAWNVAGNPAVAIPMGLDSRGLPVAAQIVGHLGQDAAVLDVAEVFEVVQPWRDLWPATVMEPQVGIHR
jgi:aspartyl-tRNA(Asn)/glutamyl-tRNA(Gln) amidotransferase subunit A